MALTKEQIAQLYVSIFNRAPEGEGMNFWLQQDKSVAEIAEWMLATKDAKEYFGDVLSDNQKFVEFVYENTLGKTAKDDPEGVKFWVNALNNGTYANKGEMIEALVYAATQPENAGPAQDQFNNRVKVALEVAEKIEKAPENYKEALGFKTEANPNGALEVDDTEESVKKAEDIINKLASADEKKDDAEDKAEDTKDDAEDKAEDTKDDAEDKAEGTKDDAEDKAEDTKDDAEDKAEDTKDDAQERMEIKFSEIAPEPENKEVPADTVITTVTIEEGYTYLLDGTDADMFTLDKNTGEIKVKTAYTPDFETKNKYEFTIKAIGEDGNIITKDIVIEVTDIEPEPSDLELTDGVDNLTEILTESDDLVKGESGTLNDGDIIVDPSTKDSDTLEVTVTKDDIAPTIMNIETINLTGEYAKVGLDLGGVIGADTINASASIIGASAKFSNVSTLSAEKLVLGENIISVDVSAAAGGTTGTVSIETTEAKNITLTGGAKEDSFSVKLAGGNVDVAIAGASGSALESLTLDSAGSAANTVGLEIASGAVLDKLVLSGDQDLAMSGDISGILGSAADAGLLVEDNGAGISTFTANGSAAASGFVNQAAFDVIDLKQGISNLTINEATKLLIETAPSASATVDVNNAKGDMGAGEGTLNLDVAVNLGSAAPLTIGANVGTVMMDQNTADVEIAKLDTATTATADTTVVIKGTKDVTITEWANDSDEVLSAGNLEGALTLGFASASAKGATVISGKGDDTITLGALASGEELTIVTGDGKDTVDASLVGTAGEATIITSAGDDTIKVGSASSVSKITVDAGDGKDTFEFAADLTIGAEDSIDNIENFVHGGSGSAGITLTIENVDVLANMEEFTGIASSGSAIDTLKIVGSNGADTINLGDIKLTNATDAVQGGAGDDTVTFVKDDVAKETFIFEATAGNNGKDTLNNFVVGNSNGDILDLSDLIAGTASTAGSAAASTDLIEDNGNAYTSNASALASASGKIAFLIDIDGGQDITTADGLKEAIASAGEYSNLDIAASGSAGSLIVITSKSDQTDDSHVFYAEQTTAGDVTITEIALVSQVDIDNFDAANFLV